MVVPYSDINNESSKENQFQSYSSFDASSQSSKNIFSRSSFHESIDNYSLHLSSENIHNRINCHLLIEDTNIILNYDSYSTTKSQNIFDIILGISMHFHVLDHHKLNAHKLHHL